MNGRLNSYNATYYTRGITRQEYTIYPLYLDILTLTALFVNSADNKLMIFFLFFPENRIWHLKSNGDNLHEMSNPVFWKNKNQKPKKKKKTEKKKQNKKKQKNIKLQYSAIIVLWADNSVKHWWNLSISNLG